MLPGRKYNAKTVSMRVAFLTDRFPRLSETFIMGQVTRLLNKGVDMHVFAQGPDENDFANEDSSQYNLESRTTYYGGRRHAFPGDWRSRIGHAGQLLSSMPASGRRALFRSLNPLRLGRDAATLRAFYAIYPFIGCGLESYDVVHCQFGNNGRIGALLKGAGIIRGVLVTSFHGNDMSRYLARVGGDVYRRLFRVGDLFLPVSGFWRDQLIGLGCPEQKIAVYRMGVDLEKFSRLEPSDRKDGSVRIVSVCRLVEKKGIEQSIRAIKTLELEHPEIRYTVVGDGPRRDDLQRLVTDLGLDQMIEFKGWLKQAEIINLLRNADILLAPSHAAADGDMEGIPVALMEGMALELPVVSTTHSGIPELVQDGKSGFLVPERDCKALADRLGWLLNNPESWRRMGKTGRSTIEEQFDLDALTDDLLQLYRTTVAGTRSQYE